MNKKRLGKRLPQGEHVFEFDYSVTASGWASRQLFAVLEEAYGFDPSCSSCFFKYCVIRRSGGFLFFFNMLFPLLCLIHFTQSFPPEFFVLQKIPLCINTTLALYN